VPRTGGDHRGSDAVLIARRRHARRVRCFDAFFPAVGILVPIIDLRQRDTWYPSPDRGGAALEWWLNVGTILGWIASTIFALSFTRLGRPAP
jgi:hypothetical protein